MQEEITDRGIKAYVDPKEEEKRRLLIDLHEKNKEGGKSQPPIVVYNAIPWVMLFLLVSVGSLIYKFGEMGKSKTDTILENVGIDIAAYFFIICALAAQASSNREAIKALIERTEQPPSDKT